MGFRDDFKLTFAENKMYFVSKQAQLSLFVETVSNG